MSQYFLKYASWNNYVVFSHNNIAPLPAKQNTELRWKSMGASEEEYCAVTGINPNYLAGYCKAAMKDLKKLSEKEQKKILNSQSYGSGSGQERAITEPMEKELLTYITQFRGAAHEGHPLHEETQNISDELERDGMRLCITYRDLVERIQEKFPEQYKPDPYKRWWRRVRDWCNDDRIRISIRTPNSKNLSVEKEKVLGERCLGTISELQCIMKFTKLHSFTAERVMQKDGEIIPEDEVASSVCVVDR